jgi:VWFA-related protein
MNVQVTDSAGNPVSNLGAGDFTIYDNNQLRKIALFHPIDGAALYDATRIVILLDAVNSPAQVLEAEKEGIFKYLASSRQPFSYPTTVVLWFNGHLQAATSATTDRNVVGRAFVKMMKGVHSNACPDNDSHPIEQRVAAGTTSPSVDPATCRVVHFRDSIAALDGIAQQQQVGGGRTLLIWVGPGWPQISDEDFQRMPPPTQRVYSEEIVNLTHNLLGGQVTLYSIFPGDKQQEGIASADPAVNVSASAQAGVIARRLELHELSQQTGGRVMSGGNDLAANIDSCVRDAEWYYALSFNTPPAENGSGELHSLAVRVNRPGLQVRTMTGYYTHP